MDEILKKLFGRFLIAGELREITVLKRGHINDTYLSRWEIEGRPAKRYVHQRVNRYVFRDVPLVMQNIEAVTKHIRLKLAAGAGIEGEQTLTIVPGRDAAPFVIDESGEYWRTYEYIEDCEVLDFCTDPDQGYRAARAFGRFENYLSDLAPDRLKEPIPRFQDSLYRFEQLEQAVQEDASGRVRSSQPELEFAKSCEQLAQLFGDARTSGQVPTRATHADPKVNNVLLSRKTGQGICIVDLDTCMPGTILYDFGDLCRTTVVPAAEDEQDFSLVTVDLELFEAVSRGFLMEFKAGLTATEQRLLPLSPQLLALTIGVRFLADHLNGDKYFRIHRENHNLERARTQFQVVRTLRQAGDKLERIVARCLK